MDDLILFTQIYVLGLLMIWLFAIHSNRNEYGNPFPKHTGSSYNDKEIMVWAIMLWPIIASVFIIMFLVWQLVDKSYDLLESPLERVWEFLSKERSLTGQGEKNDG